MPALKTQGVLFKRGTGAGTPEVFNTVGQVRSVAGPDGEAADINVTNLASVRKEFLVGLADEGNVSINGFLDPSDTAQMGMKSDRDAGTKRNFEIHLTDATPTKLAFAAYVKSFAINIAEDSAIEYSATLRITGAVTWTP